MVAACFAGLFALVAMMAELVVMGTFRMTPAGAALMAAAFVGYLGVAALLRRSSGPSGDR